MNFIFTLFYFRHQVEFLNRIDTMIGELIIVTVPLPVVPFFSLMNLQELAQKEQETGIW